MASSGLVELKENQRDEVGLELDSVGFHGLGINMRSRRFTNDLAVSKPKRGVTSRNSYMHSSSTTSLVDSLPVGNAKAGNEYKGIVASLKGLFWRKAESQAVLQFKQRSIESQSQIELYAKNEWATTLPNAMKMKRGYAKVKEGGYSFIRRIRGDNYCALRSVMFQILTASDTQKSILSLYSLDSALARLDDLRRDYKDLLAEWKFGTNAFLREGNGVMHSLQECVRTFFEIVKKLNAYQSSQEKRDLLVEEMNKEENNYFATDAKLVECVKFFMFSQAERLYKKQVSGKDVPLWFTLLTLRGNSSSLEEYFREQLNKVGDSLGLEQVEMCLLSSSINARIKVFRLSSIDKDDFETLYPSEGTAEFGQEVTLCAEDDRHYNVVYKP